MRRRASSGVEPHESLQAYTQTDQKSSVLQQILQLVRHSLGERRLHSPRITFAGLLHGLQAAGTAEPDRC